MTQTGLPAHPQQQEIPLGGSSLELWADPLPGLALVRQGWGQEPGRSSGHPCPQHKPGERSCTKGISSPAWLKATLAEVFLQAGAAPAIPVAQAESSRVSQCALSLPGCAQTLNIPFSPSTAAEPSWRRTGNCIPGVQQAQAVCPHSSSWEGGFPPGSSAEGPGAEQKENMER